MPTREWARTDYYAELGVGPTASSDEISAAFRARARELHPDARPADDGALERFKRMTVAYRVLIGPTRRDYDRARQRGRDAPTAPVPVAPRGPVSGFHLGPRSARRAFVAGIASIVLGLVAVGVVMSLQARDARLRGSGTATTATVVLDGGTRRLEFTTRDGATHRVGVPDTKSGDVPDVGDRVDIRYDPHDPSHVATPANTTARDITLWIVAGKLLLVGGVLTGLGVHFRRVPKSVA